MNFLKDLSKNPYFRGLIIGLIFMITFTVFLISASQEIPFVYNQF